jgi:hypothetical protein
MSLDQPQKNKMMQTPPVKKGFHFASDDFYYAEFIEAEAIEEATAMYHKIKRLISAASTTASSTPIPPQATVGGTV